VQDDLVELLLGERAGLVQDRLAGADLPDVVQLPAKPDSLQRCPANPIRSAVATAYWLTRIE
jgi:hypothetical protein